MLRRSLPAPAFSAWSLFSLHHLWAEFNLSWFLWAFVLTGGVVGAKGSHYNFHFLKCLREHPGFYPHIRQSCRLRFQFLSLSCHQNKWASQRWRLSELPAIHDPCSRWSLMGKAGRMNHFAAFVFPLLLGWPNHGVKLASKREKSLINPLLSGKWNQI